MVYVATTMVAKPDRVSNDPCAAVHSANRVDAATRAVAPRPARMAQRNEARLPWSRFGVTIHTETAPVFVETLIRALRRFRRAR
jgi:hypothetical protein